MKTVFLVLLTLFFYHSGPSVGPSNGGNTYVSSNFYRIVIRQLDSTVVSTSIFWIINGAVGPCFLSRIFEIL